VGLDDRKDAVDIAQRPENVDLLYEPLIAL